MTNHEIVGIVCGFLIGVCTVVAFVHWCLCVDLVFLIQMYFDPSNGGVC